MTAERDGGATRAKLRDLVSLSQPARRAFSLELRGLAVVVLPMALSFLLLLLGFIAHHIRLPSTGEFDTVKWSGASLKLTKGSGRVEGYAVEVDALSRTGTAILRLDDKAISTERYPFLAFQTEGFWAGTEAFFFWKTREGNEKTFSATLPWSGDGVAIVYLGRHPDWQGTAIMFGIGVEGKLRDKVRIGPIELRAFSVGSLLAAVWTDWTAFEGWHQYSLHFIIGGPHDPIVHEVPAVAAWIGLSLLLYVGWAWARLRPWDWRATGAIFLLGWFSLDAQWGLELFRQLQETKHRFAEKSWSEKYLAAEDGILFKQMEMLKKNLPRDPQRIFLVTEDPFDRDEYKRLRAQYHLLPHNVYSNGDLPAAQNYARDGDYVIMLGSNPPVTFDIAQSLIKWNGEIGLEAQPILKVGDAVLLKIDSH